MILVCFLGVLSESYAVQQALRVKDLRFRAYCLLLGLTVSGACGLGDPKLQPKNPKTCEALKNRSNRGPTLLLEGPSIRKLHGSCGLRARGEADAAEGPKEHLQVSTV